MTCDTTPMIADLELEAWLADIAGQESSAPSIAGLMTQGYSIGQGSLED